MQIQIQVAFQEKVTGKNTCGEIGNKPRENIFGLLLQSLQDKRGKVGRCVETPPKLFSN